MSTLLTKSPATEPDATTGGGIVVVKGKPDFSTIEKLATSLLRSGLNEYQQRLNSKLLGELTASLSKWLADFDSEIQSQLKHVPQHAREKWLKERVAIDDRRTPESQAIRFLTDFLFQCAERKLLDLRQLRQGNQAFRNTVAKIVSPRQREEVILRYAEELGASTAQLKGDQQAFARWFDEEAVTDRYAKQVGTAELLLAFVLERISTIVDRCFSLVRERAPSDKGLSRDERIAGIWNRLKIERRIQAALDYDGDERIKVAALKCLSAALSRMPSALAESLLNKRTLLLLHRTVVEARADVWVQCEALSLLATLSLSRSMPLLRQRLANPRQGDDIFVRRHIYRMLTEHLLTADDRCVELPRREDEPSPFVRQAMAKAAFLSTDDATHRQWCMLATEDDTVQVRAAALLVGAEVPCTLSKTIDFLQTIVQALQSDQDPFVLRTTMHVVAKVMEQVSLRPDDIVGDAAISENEVRRETAHAFYHQRIRPRLIRLQRSHENPAVRRWAAQAREKCWMLTERPVREVFFAIRPHLAKIGIGQTKRLSKRLFGDLDRDRLGRMFAVLSQSDFGYDIQWGRWGVDVTRGPVFGFRLWRLVFECTHTATDKRQALRHTVGRINSAPMRAPSQIGGELSETKVPGEPVTIGDDGTWRPFMPLMDDFVSILNRSWVTPRSTEFYTSQGVTKVTGPKGIHRRIKAAVKLNLRFAQYADKRNWDDETYAASTYIQSMRDLGFAIEFREYDCDEQTGQARDATTQGDVSAKQADVSAEDESVTKFFTTTTCLGPLLGLSTIETIKQHFLRFADYFSSAFENTIEHLLVFTSVLLIVILAKHGLSNYRFRKARRNIPLSIGGWGTRGKSGTERLKAALVGAMGHGLVSKTTGCEAMFIHADPNGEPLEIPLFRPFDKATIWEQHNLILMASRMNPSVFLWECMALTPSYVDVLSRQWTCDDLATITNTYPDHEDLQGPAGHDVATTISGFVPLQSHVLTTEEQMRPYISESCRHAKSTLRGVGWLESGLITDDVLDRFPYKEHPDNVALVAAMGEELGVDYDFSLKAMGDYLVPDLGVLKTHPVATVRTRRIEFTNGMSANERFGCMGNIRRLGFDTQDPWDEPTTWVSGVVNNRADRVPRSKVFAKIIIEDMTADRFFLIGNNLKGLLGMIDEAWDEHGKSLSLRDQGQAWDTTFALKALRQAAWDYRQPIEPQHVQAKLTAMIDAVVDDAMNMDTQSLVAMWEQPESIAKELDHAGVKTSLVQSIQRHAEDLKTGLAEFQALKQSVEATTPQQSEQIESEYVKMLRRWYDRKLVVIDNYDATGEDVVARVVDETPPGFLNRTIGLQNIKGTGLDFVYRFQAWDVCSEACQAILSPQSQIAQRGLQTLMSMPAIGQLCQQRLRECVREALKSPALRRSDLQADLAVLEKRIAEAIGEENDDGAMVADVDDKPSSSENVAQWQSWMLDRSEQLVDLNDSLRRRDTADRIYKDLADSRISRQRAVVELRNINKRQKGGWLTTAFSGK
ncbi:hypothetical protein [Planctomycetes bacterium K23_9]|uniref:Capsule biosynthesis protein CapB n=1 Tax=Stieleria marina TaxID=1930275 RepID=A0A517NXI8_9BACT|nr:Capsule biosynthesis protein CapB [Planctomycetes bacterium K23_9]